HHLVQLNYRLFKCARIDDWTLLALGNEWIGDKGKSILGRSTQSLFTGLLQPLDHEGVVQLPFGPLILEPMLDFRLERLAFLGHPALDQALAVLSSCPTKEQSLGPGHAEGSQRLT